MRNLIITLFYICPSIFAEIRIQGESGMTIKFSDKKNEIIVENDEKEQEEIEEDQEIMEEELEETLWKIETEEKIAELEASNKALRTIFFINQILNCLLFSSFLASLRKFKKTQGCIILMPPQNS